MGFSNTVQKITEKLLGGNREETIDSSIPAREERKTKTIDLPDLQGGDAKDNFSSKLGAILSESELEHQKRVGRLKNSVKSGKYSVNSQRVANSILDYPGGED